MKIDVATLIKVATPLLAVIQAKRTAQQDYTDEAFQALGMLTTFVHGYQEDGGPSCERCGAALDAEATAQCAVNGLECYINCSTCATSQF
jgi:hypothetical protein